jgi:hypothetical protein
MGEDKRLKHGAYQVMRLAKEGHLPDKRTRLGKAVEAVRKGIVEHFGGELNPLQQFTLFTLMPKIAFWFEHPMTTDKGTLAADWKYIDKRIEEQIKELERQTTTGNDKKPLGLDDYLKAQYGNTS